MAPSRKDSNGTAERPVHVSGSYAYLQSVVHAKGKEDDHTCGRAPSVTARGVTVVRRLFSKEYVTVERMPEQYRERFLVRGYRQAYSSFLDCLVSPLRPNNETLNIWTHTIPLLLLLVYFWKTFPGRLWPLTAIESRYYPLLSVESSVCAYILCSSLAHLFNCMTPRIRHICFYFDYAAISMYGIGGACATFFYLRPLYTEHILFNSPNLYLSFASLLSVLACYVNCASRHNWDGMKYVVRTLALTGPFVYGNLPTFYRFLECGWTGHECSYTLVYFFYGWTFYFVSAVLNATRIPERFYPSTFDIVGHNHQWLHVTTTLGTVAHIFAVFNDLEHRMPELEAISLPHATFMATLGWTAVTFALTVAMAVWFGASLTSSGHLYSKNKTS